MIRSLCDTNQAFVDNDLRLKLAGAVMALDERRGLPLVDRGGCKTTTRERGEPQDWTPVADLVARGTAYMVLVDDDLLVLDADNDRQAATVRHVAEQLDADGQRYVIVRSGRPGHLQLWARVGRRKRTRIEQRVRDALQERPDARPDARESRWVRPPLSPHTAGYAVALDNVSPAEAVEILQARGPSTRPVRPVRSGRGQRDVHALVDRLGPGARRTLEHGTERRRDDGQSDRSAGQFSVLMSCDAAGFTPAEVETLFGGPFKATEKFRQSHARNAQSATRNLLDDYGRAQLKRAGRVVVDDPHSARVALAQVDAVIDTHPWTHDETSDKAILRAHVRHARRQGRISGYYASLRSVALAAGLSPSTVSRRQGRLVHAGWLVAVAPPGQDKAATWAIGPALRDATPLHSTQGGCDGCCTAARADFADDVWRPAGLGHRAGNVFDALCDCTDATAANLAEQFGYASAQPVRKILRRLEAKGLALRTDHGWRRGDSTPAEAAEIAGCTGESEWYEAQSRRERNRFKRQCDAGRGTETTTVDSVTGEVMPDLAFKVVESPFTSRNDVAHRNLMAA